MFGPTVLTAYLKEANDTYWFGFPNGRWRLGCILVCGTVLISHQPPLCNHLLGTNTEAHPSSPAFSSPAPHSPAIVFCWLIQHTDNHIRSQYLTVSLSLTLSLSLSTGSYLLIDRFPSGALRWEPGNRSSRTAQGGLGPGEMLMLLKKGSFGDGDTTGWLLPPLRSCLVLLCVCFFSNALCVSHTLILF